MEYIYGNMETPLFLPQPARRIDNSHPENSKKDSKPQIQVHPKRNRLKRAKTHTISDNTTGNNPTHVTGTPESVAFCKRTFTDVVITNADKDMLVHEEHHSQTVQSVSIPAKREHVSVDCCFNTDHFGPDAEAITSCLGIHRRDRDQPHDPGQNSTSSNLTKPICNESTNTRTVRETRSGWRKKIPSEISCELLQKIQKLSLQFPVQRFFTFLKKKRTAFEEESSNLEAEKTDDYNHQSAFSVQRKRKQELEEQYRTCKRHRTNKGIGSADKLDFEKFSDNLIDSNTMHRNRLSRTKRRKQQITFCAVVIEPVINDTVHQNPSLGGDDVLWTDKYQPQQSSEVIGNSASVRQLQSWLKDWKIRADTEEWRRRQEERRMEKEDANESWDCGDFVGDAVSIDHEKELCNTVLMTGPSGVGKTAAVYACAQELGFKVFEVNSSVLRSGKLILSQLTEATQSHQMDIQRIKTLKSEVNNQRQIKPALPCKESHRRVTSSSKGTSLCHSASILIKKPQTVKLTHFFKLSSKKSLGKTSDGPERCIHAAVELKPERLQQSGTGFKDKREGDMKSDSKNPTPVRQRHTIPVSLILFEEVDVIFPEDVGFLTAIKTFMSTTKRPIILTTNDPLFGTKLKGHFDEIHFHTPSLETIRSYLQCLCVVENMWTDPEDIAFLLCQNKGDIRQSILQLQLWVCSGGGSTQLQILKNTLQCRSWTELENSRCLEILADRTGQGLLYSNIESLLSQSFYLQESINPNTKGENSVKGLMVQNVHANKSDRLSTCRGKKHRSLYEPETISYPHSDLKKFSVDESSKTSVPLKRTNRLASETDDESLILVFQHVLCTANFFDNMSFLDACLQKPFISQTGFCKTEPFGWIGATLEDGLLDLPGEEQTRQSFDDSSQILAFVEGLGFYQCRTELSRIWSEAARLKEKMSSERWEEMICSLSQPFGSKTLRTCHCKICEPRTAQKQKELVSKLSSSKNIYCFTNKRALFMDYLPTLRSICRSERDKGLHSFRRSHHLSSLHLPKSILELMALDFP